MQGRPGQGNGPMDREKEREKLTAARMAAIKVTGPQRAIPQRPSGMTHLDTAPETPRVPRPQRQAPPSKKMRKGTMILGGVFAVVAIIALTLVGLVVYAANQTDPSAATATDFLSSLSESNYQQAFKDLGPGITLRINQQQFSQQAQGVDKSAGPITTYVEVANTATTQSNGTLRSYTYTITRKNLKKTYQMHLVLQQDPEDQNNWKISDYGSSLGPTR